MSNPLPLAAAIATANAYTYRLSGSGPDPFRPYAGTAAKHKSEPVPDWVQAEKMRKAQEKRARKAARRTK